MSKYQIYQKFAFLTIDDIQNIIQESKPSVSKLIEQDSDASEDDEPDLSKTFVVVRAPPGSTIEKISPKKNDDEFKQKLEIANFRYV